MRKTSPFGHRSGATGFSWGSVYSVVALPTIVGPLANGIPFPPPTHSGGGVSGLGMIFFAIIVGLVVAAIAWLVVGLIRQRRGQGENAPDED